jgi:formate dehydrogenase assembly factor FdhD
MSKCSSSHFHNLDVIHRGCCTHCGGTNIVPANRPESHWEMKVVSMHSDHIDSNMKKMYDAGWEVSGLTSTYHCHQGNDWLLVPFKRETT